ncbi:MAG: hypothetical protein LQ348_001761 [Seirophora lacunosa]|nr:MAG: hypothetical protein LQ344_002798 [Seirophora lacunosa]KAI4200385.1 MAG: hypothetical protein LQ348_001761 [Seirophora lacunosa]
MATKYLLVSGGVISGIGKGVIASSLGVLLKSIGLKVTSIKIDPYMNIDAGLMNPLEHGECFVLDDGGEVDLDLGNYERYLNITLTREHNITTGKIYQHVIELERKGKYLGKTVQIVPHLTDAVQDWIQKVAAIPVDSTSEKPDVCIIELGGTVGDIESASFIEALRCLRRRAGQNNFLHCHVSLIPVINEEQKTKPTQASIKDVRHAGLSPDIIACRCSLPLLKSTTDKLAMYCQVEPEQVIAVHDVPSTYHVPLLLERQGLIPILREVLRLDALPIAPPMVRSGSEIWETWKTLTDTQDRARETVKICLVGKYVSLHDSYLSVRKSLEHASMRCGRKLEIIWLDSADLEIATEMTSPVTYHKAWHQLCTASGILVPGGFGHRGIEGMIRAAKWAREKKVPYLGICLGMQIAVIEFCRTICGIEDAQSEEMDDSAKNKVIVHMPEVSKETMGAVMRLGLRNTVFQENSGFSKLRTLYEPETMQTNGVLPESNTSTTATADGEVATKSSPSQPPVISERHRHKYEVNPEFVPTMATHGLEFIGKDESGERMEILELRDHPWYVGVQYHPEYLSRVLRPSMPYLGFFAAAAGCMDDVMTKGTKTVKGTTKVLVNGS